MDAEKIRAQVKEIQKLARHIQNDDWHTASKIEKAAKLIEDELPKPPPGKPFRWDAVG